MTTSFDDYQARCASTAVYPDKGTGSPAALAYVALGLGEVGELQAKVADLLTSDNPNDLAEVGAETGDVLWYIAQMAAELGQPLSAIAAHRSPSGRANTIREFARWVTVRTDAPDSIATAALALCAAGDVQGMVKKILRGDPATTDPAYRDKVARRLADLLVAVTTLTEIAGIRLEDVAQANLDKLADRAARGVLKGAGDHR